MTRAQFKRRLATVGTGILIALVAAGGVFSWREAWSDATERFVGAQQQIARVEWLLDHQDELKERLTKAVADAGSTGGFIVGTPDEATSVLQQQIGAFAETSAGSVISSQPLPVRTVDGGTIVAVRYQIVTTVSGLTQFLYLLENNRPFIFIDSIDIVRQPDAGDPMSVRLVLQLDVHALTMGSTNG